jgi:hypothetical protein
MEAPDLILPLESRAKLMSLAKDRRKQLAKEEQYLWDKIFGTHPYQNERVKKVIEYICHRIADGAHLRDIVEEEYVRRNASPVEVQEILENPRLIEVAHQAMREDFSSEALKL